MQMHHLQDRDRKHGIQGGCGREIRGADWRHKRVKPGSLLNRGLVRAAGDWPRRIGPLLRRCRAANEFFSTRLVGTVFDDVPPTKTSSLRFGGRFICLDIDELP